MTPCVSASRSRGEEVWYFIDEFLVRSEERIARSMVALSGRYGLQKYR
jgi:hypothetical protein